MPSHPLGPANSAVISLLEQIAQTGEPMPGQASLVDVGTAHFLRYWKDEVLDGTVANGGATVRVFEGAYGSGKTHLLDLLEGEAFSKGMAVVRATLSDTVQLTNPKLVTEYILQRMRLRTPGGEHRSLPGIIAGANAGSAFSAAAQSPHRGFATAIARIAGRHYSGPAARDLLERYLRGERVRVGDLAAAGVRDVKMPLNARNGEHVLKTVLGNLPRYGVTGTALLFDENERTFLFAGAHPTQRVRAAANLLRRLIDASAFGSIVHCVAVFAVLPGFVENAAIAYPALGQRLHVDGDTTGYGWRWPVLQVEDVSTITTPAAFADAAMGKLVDLAHVLGVTSPGLRDRMHEVAGAVLARQAGSGYRRELMKALATSILAATDTVGIR